MVLCKFCGREIHFDERVKSKSGKFISLSGRTGAAKHRFLRGRSTNKPEGNGGSNNAGNRCGVNKNGLNA